MFLYRLLSPLIGLALLCRALWAVLRGTEGWGDMRQRIMGPRVTCPAVWVHGASVGEMNAARPIIAALAQEMPVLVTATTTTGRATVCNWGLVNVQAGLAPLDWRWITRRFLRRNRITGLVIIENELWPNRIITCHKNSLPVAMVNARMSAGSARTWQRFGGLAQHVLKPMILVAPQDSESAARLTQLGVRSDALASPVNLKGLYVPNHTQIPHYLRARDPSQTVLAAATHPGEDDIALSALKIMRATRPDIGLIIAPRHPVRGAEIGTAAEAAGFSVAFHSSDDAPDTDVFIADTLGDMHLWYRLAGVAFIGGSLVNKGGHTPFEPAAYGCPILFGPHVANFTDTYAALTKANGAVEVTDAASLAQAALAHIGDTSMAARAKAALDQPDITPLLDQIRQALGPNT
ncbi:3-deoxy-D-manno-octulosonic-acid transferase [Cognatiyoonia koreensis]|uniref:3-deoxy-D-manno-octulosonic acid transferase n=1 Tax=Cognatiyoonia koreensis TaxID=364200 RepID=A0A1I0MSB7_9RHOB|nr:glycosyltransferase N-terminal domain-containing protein [Cognatiyoonia koreensis]SEV90797.1 3-deoxy-D-manno-octulosonic-acid transferase [Cognatiyoonia koreensis]